MIRWRLPSIDAEALGRWDVLAKSGCLKVFAWVQAPTVAKCQAGVKWLKKERGILLQFFDLPAGNRCDGRKTSSIILFVRLRIRAIAQTRVTGTRSLLIDVSRFVTQET